MRTRTAMRQLKHLLDPADLETLLRIPQAELIGSILRLNKDPHYRNTLDAIALTACLLEVRSKHPGRRHRPVSSPHIPASSDRIPGTLGGQVLLYCSSTNEPAT